MSIVKNCTRCSLEKECPYGRNYCRDCNRLFCKEYKKRHKDRINEYNKKYKLEHVNIISEYNRKYNEDNRIKIGENHKKNRIIRIKKDENYKYSCLIRSSINRYINGSRKNSKYKCYLSCDIEKVRKWIEYQFKEWMTWENYGSCVEHNLTRCKECKIWHLDHVIPIAFFDLTKEEDRYICFHWANIQPLLNTENDSKNDKIEIEKICMEKMRNFSINNKIEVNNYIEFLTRI